MNVSWIWAIKNVRVSGYLILFWVDMGLNDTCLSRMCECLDINLIWVADEWTRLHDSSLSFISWIWAIIFSSPFFWHYLWACGIPSFGYASFLSSFSPFLTCLVGMWYTFFGYASFISSYIAHILDGNFGERESHRMT